MSEIQIKPEMKQGPQMFYQLGTEQLKTKVIILDEEDLSQTIQFLRDQIAELEKRLITLEGSNNNI